MNVEEMLCVKEEGAFLCKKNAQQVTEDARMQKVINQLGMTTMKALVDTKLLCLTEASMRKFIEQCPEGAPIIKTIMRTDIVDTLEKMPFFSAPAPQSAGGEGGGDANSSPRAMIGGMSPRTSDRTALRALADLTHFESAAVGDVIFRQSDTDADKLYIIIQGEVTVSAASEQEIRKTTSMLEIESKGGTPQSPATRELAIGKAQVTVATLGVGSHFGEMALLVHMPRSATITAKEKCLFLTLQRTDLVKFYTVARAIHDKMLQHVKERMLGMLRTFNVPLFANTPEQDLPELAFLCDIEQHLAGDIVWGEGDVRLVFTARVVATTIHAACYSHNPAFCLLHHTMLLSHTPVNKCLTSPTPRSLIRFAPSPPPTTGRRPLLHRGAGRGGHLQRRP